MAYILTHVAPGLEIPLAVVSSQSTVCRVTNDTDTPICIDAQCVFAMARNVCLNDVTEMYDFVDHVSANEIHATIGQLMVKMTMIQILMTLCLSLKPLQVTFLIIIMMTTPSLKSKAYCTWSSQINLILVKTILCFHYCKSRWQYRILPYNWDWWCKTCCLAILSYFSKNS